MNLKVANSKVNTSELLGVLMIVVGSIQVQLPIYQQLFTPVWQGIFTSGVGIAMLVLRYLEAQERNKRADDVSDAQDIGNK